MSFQLIKESLFVILWICMCSFLDSFKPVNQLQTKFVYDKQICDLLSNEDAKSVFSAVDVDIFLWDRR